MIDPARVSGIQRGDDEVLFCRSLPPRRRRNERGWPKVPGVRRRDMTMRYRRKKLGVGWVVEGWAAEEKVGEGGEGDGSGG